MIVDIVGSRRLSMRRNVDARGYLMLDVLAGGAFQALAVIVGDRCQVLAVAVGGILMLRDELGYTQVVWFRIAADGGCRQSHVPKRTPLRPV